MKNQMKCCNANMTDVTYRPNTDRRIPHFYCIKCGRHYYKKKYYAAEDWFYFINGVAYDKQINKF